MPRTTQKDVAREAGIHPSTVSLVMGGRPGIPEETRQRVLDAAQRLGYERDPMLGALAAYRRSSRPEQFHGVLAWLYDSTGGFNFRKAEEYRSYFDGVMERSLELGYRVELMDMAAYEHNPRRIAGVCSARSIRGMFVSPQPNANVKLNLVLDNVAAVAIGHTLQEPEIHAVTSDDYDSMRILMHELQARDYKRIGYALPKQYTERVRRLPLAAFLAEQSILDAALVFDQLHDHNALSEWIESARLDALVTTQYELPAILKELNKRTSTKLGVALVSLSANTKGCAGIDECSFVVGQTAAELLTSLVERGQFGIPAHPQRVMVRGAWREGNTVRPRS